MPSKPETRLSAIKTRDDIPAFCAARGYMLMAEVGVREGKHLKSLLRARPKLLVAVDIWRDDGVASHNDRGESQARIDEYLAAVRDLAATYPAIKIVREYSDKAAAQFPDGFFDFVYLDADHRYEAVDADIKAWWPKVRFGGVLGGHDYLKAVVGAAKTRVGVIQAVTELHERTHCAVYTTAQAERYPSWFMERG